MGFVEGMIICFIGGGLNSYLIYINVINAKWFEIIPWIHIPSNIPASEVGQYWMFTPGVMFGLGGCFDLQITYFNGLGWDLFAFILFISYIWWFTIGQNLVWTIDV